MYNNSVSFLSVKSCVGGASTVCLRTIRLKASCLQSRVDYMDGSNQCDQIWRNFKSLLLFFGVFFVFGKILNIIWYKCYAIGQIFVDVNGQILKTNLAILSRWFQFGH